MAYVFLNDLYDAVVNSGALSKADKIELIEHIANTTDASILRHFITDDMAREWIEDYTGELVPFLNDDEVEQYIEWQGSTCLDKFLNDDVITDYCDYHGYKVLMGDEDDKDAVMEWCKEHNYVCFKKKDG